MLDNIIAMYYRDMGSTHDSGQIQIATQNQTLEYHGISCRRSSFNGLFEFRINYINDKKSIYDELFLRDKQVIQSGRHYEASLDDLENPTKTDFICDHKIVDTKHAKKATKIIKAFKEKFDSLIIRRNRKIQRLYPIKPELFFENNAGLGAVFKEHYSIIPIRICCDIDAGPGAGFFVDAETQNYTFKFSYSNHQPHKRDENHAGTFHIGRNNHGFEVAINLEDNISRINETGSFNNIIGEQYHGPGLKNGRGKEVHRYVSRLWRQFVTEFDITSRMEQCDNLNPRQLKKVLKSAEYFDKWVVNARNTVLMEAFYERDTLKEKNKILKDKLDALNQVKK